MIRISLIILFAVLLISCKQQNESPLTITSFSPGSGPVGSLITIEGTGFSKRSQDNIVTIGNVVATVAIADPGILIVRVPQGAIGGRISITRGEITRRSITNFVVTDQSETMYNAGKNYSFPVQNDFDRALTIF